MLHVIFARVRNGFHSPAGLGKKSERAGAGGAPNKKDIEPTLGPLKLRGFQHVNF